MITTKKLELAKVVRIKSLWDVGQCLMNNDHAIFITSSSFLYYVGFFLRKRNCSTIFLLKKFEERRNFIINFIYIGKY